MARRRGLHQYRSMPRDAYALTRPQDHPDPGDAPQHVSQRAVHPARAGAQDRGRRHLAQPVHRGAIRVACEASHSSCDIPHIARPLGWRTHSCFGGAILFLQLWDFCWVAICTSFSESCEGARVTDVGGHSSALWWLGHRLTDIHRCVLQGNQHFNYLLKAFADANPNVHYLVPAASSNHASVSLQQHDHASRCNTVISNCSCWLELGCAVSADPDPELILMLSLTLTLAS